MVGFTFGATYVNNDQSEIKPLFQNQNGVAFAVLELG